MGGEKSDHRVNSFLGTLGTKIFHANADIETNRYGSQLIGQGYTEDAGRSTSVAGKVSITNSVSYKLEQMVRPEMFAKLKIGGPVNEFVVACYIHR